jgi:hypothetical protein
MDVIEQAREVLEHTSRPSFRLLIALRGVSERLRAIARGVLDDPGD